MESGGRSKQAWSGGEAYYRNHMETLSKDNKRLKAKLEQLERENLDLKKSVFDLSTRLTMTQAQLRLIGMQATPSSSNSSSAASTGASVSSGSSSAAATAAVTPSSSSSSVPHFSLDELWASQRHHSTPSVPTHSDTCLASSQWLRCSHARTRCVGVVWVVWVVLERSMRTPSLLPTEDDDTLPHAPDTSTCS